MKARNANISRKILGELSKEALSVMVARQQGSRGLGPGGDFSF